MLHGRWLRSVGGRAIDTVPVPGSYLPVGECMLEYTFDCPWDADADAGRYFLCTEGVLSRAEFSVNGQPVGTAGPWVPYRFELPKGALRRRNTASATVSDIQEEFGPTPGRLIEAGLFRDLYIERRPAAYIESVAFRPRLNDDCTAAECEVHVDVDGPTEELDFIEAVLIERESGREVCDVVGAVGDTLTFHVDRPLLWSPESPSLYTLIVSLRDDVIEETVGFRRIEVRGQDFYLNNHRIFLKGVCRHEFTSASGYCPPEEEVRHELAQIKHAGFNYIRLVHSPQSPVVPRIAAELGLLVSEEPGTCWQDLGIDEVAAPALEVLRRTVLRDRNCPSVLAWYIYNECNANSKYAVNAARICRELDPERLISFADCSLQHDDIHAMVEAADLSFYGINRYALFPHEYAETMSHYQDRPLVITEWGGWLAQGNPRIMKNLCDAFVRCSRPGASPRLSGCTFWAWADYHEYSRDDPACIDGWTVEGLLDQTGQPKPDLQTISRMFLAIDHPEPLLAPKVEVLLDSPLRREDWTPVSLSGIEGDQSALESEIEQRRIEFAYSRPVFGELLLDGIRFACRDDEGIAPLLIGPGREEIVVPIGREVRIIAILGQVALKGGYPSPGLVSTDARYREGTKVVGAPASRYVFRFEDGDEEQALLHGVHILRGNNICRWWMTAPRAPETRPAVQTTLHPTYEILRFDLWEHDFGRPRYLRELRWRLDGPDSIQAIIAISVRM